MEIVINKSKIHGDEKEIIRITDKCATLEVEGSFPTVISENTEMIKVLFSRFFSLTYTWKHEYVGPRTMDGEKYLISLDINHKRKTYKIQNKYPDNWEEFVDLKNSLLDGGYFK